MKCFRAFLGLLSNVTLFPNKLMLQNASYMCFFKKETKQNKKTTKKKKVSPGWSRTEDLQRVRATHYPLRHATIVSSSN